MPGQRLFVALELPERVRLIVAEWALAAAEAMGPGVRPVAQESLHVTLCFLGSVDPSEIPEVARACESVRGGLVGPLSLGDAVWLPRRRPRVLAVGVVDPHGQLGAVQRELARALSAAGVFESEGRPFFAHVTAARVRREARLPHGPPPPPTADLVAERIVLYRSHLGHGPARYEALHDVALSQR